MTLDQLTECQTRITVFKGKMQNNAKCHRKKIENKLNRKKEQCLEKNGEKQKMHSLEMLMRKLSNQEKKLKKDLLPTQKLECFHLVILS